MQDLKVISFSISSAFHWLPMQHVGNVVYNVKIRVFSIYTIMMAKCLSKALGACTLKLAG